MLRLTVIAEPARPTLARDHGELKCLPFFWRTWWTGRPAPAQHMPCYRSSAPGTAGEHGSLDDRTKTKSPELTMPSHRRALSLLYLGTKAETQLGRGSEVQTNLRGLFLLRGALSPDRYQPPPPRRSSFTWSPSSSQASSAAGASRRSVER